MSDQLVNDLTFIFLIGLILEFFHCLYTKTQDQLRLLN